MPAKKTKKKTIKTKKKIAKARSTATRKKSAESLAAVVVTINCGCLGHPSTCRPVPKSLSLDPGNIVKMHALNARVEITFVDSGGNPGGPNDSPFESHNTHFFIPKGTFHPDEIVRTPPAAEQPKTYTYHVDCTNPSCTVSVDDGEMIVP